MDAVPDGVFSMKGTDKEVPWPCQGWNLLPAKSVVCVHLWVAENNKIDLSSQFQSLIYRTGKLSFIIYFKATIPPYENKDM